jgi:hypothetical protein
LIAPLGAAGSTRRPRRFDWQAHVREPPCPIARSRQLTTDIVKRANTRDVLGPARVGVRTRPAFGGSGAMSSSSEAAGQPGQSFQVYDTDREGGADREIVAASDAPSVSDYGGVIGSKSTSVQDASGLAANHCHAKGPVFFWIGSSAIRAFGGCLGSKRR